METKLFLELSEEQQEVTSGGGQLINASEFDATEYGLQLVNLNKTIASGPNGSFITKNLSTAFLFTSAEEYLNLYFR